MEFTMVLEDDLAEELCKFKNQENYDDRIVERILHYYKPPILLNKQYMQRFYGEEILSSLAGVNCENPSFDEPLESLAKITFYKIILSKEKSDFPYVNIFKDKIENNLTATFYKNKERSKARKHFEDLFHNAQHLFIYDKYLHNHQDSLEKFAKYCLPKQKLSIFYPLSLKFDQKLCSKLKQICQDWTISQNNAPELNSYDDMHDRYIVVDKKIQIILTSGIDYLIDETKDFTYIVRLFET